MKSLTSILNKALAICLLSCILCACGQQEGKILSQKKMAEVLTDVYLTEALLQNLDKKKKTDWSRGLHDIYFQDLAYRQILDKYHITEEEFYASVAHYSQEYKTFAKIYGQVELNLKALQEEVVQRELIKTQLRKLAQEEARLIAALDTASYIKWFEIWQSDSLLFEADSSFFGPAISLYPYNISTWLSPVPADTLLWSVVDHLPPIQEKQSEESQNKDLPKVAQKNLIRIDEK